MIFNKHTDSFERIRKDKEKAMPEYWGCTGKSCYNCPSMVNGCNPMERYHVCSCEEAQKLDISRRLQKMPGETCVMKNNFDNIVCSSCGDIMFGATIRNYCPNCGRGIVKVI